VALNSLYISYAVTVLGNIIVIATAWPAFKRTRFRGFLFIAFASGLGIFDTICDHTIGGFRMSLAQRAAYYSVRRIGYFGDIIFLTIGIVLLTRRYLASSESKPEAK
jgi:hypothetical protein